MQVEIYQLELNKIDNKNQKQKSIINKAHRVKSSDYITDIKIRAAFLRNKLLILCLDVEVQVKMLRICIIPSLFLLSCEIN